MPERTVRYLLVGGGLASANCARHLREEGADGAIVIIGRELDPPYNRPPLSKGYLRGQESIEDVLFRPDSWYAEQQIEVMTRTSVMSLDLRERVAKLSNKQELGFEKALVATGANVHILHVDGAQLDGIHYLRTMRNSDALRDELAQAERVTLIGGSFIATELAASMTALGKRCEMTMLEAVTLEAPFGAEVGRFFQGVLEDHGVTVHGGQQLERFEGADGRVSKVVTKSGLELECDFVVLGTGVHPELRLAQQAGLETGSGVLTDRFLETSSPGVFAAGDVAEYDSVVHGKRMRIEHWDVAFNQGRYAALNMLGRELPYDVVPYFWSDLADWVSLESVGPATDWDEVWWRGSAEEGRFTAWYVKDSRLAGAVTVGRPEDLAVAARLLAGKVEIAGKRELIEDLDSDIVELG